MRDAPFDPSRLRALRSGIIAGGPVSEKLADRVREWCDVEIAYGLTATGPTASVTRPGDADGRRSAMVGRA
jgi:fatty-acyl-CoA synthase